MPNKYQEYNGLNMPNIASKVLADWETNKIFEKSITTREGKPPFVFFEGPPSANGLPGIHHVMARSIKDIFCRYKTLKGFQVKRKAGWDTHGLPVELGVEKELGITKEDIGKKITIEEYNEACKKAVMRYTDVWNDLTQKMGYWVDMEDPYITYESKYMESVWWLLKNLYEKDLMYKGYTIQPYSPKAGTGLSSHEINQPGCYQDVKDTSAVAMFKVTDADLSKINTLFGKNLEEAFFIAWTTTPWTLPSNTALTVGPKIDYVLVHTYNQYTAKPIQVILAKNLVSKQFSGKYTAVESLSEIDGYTAQDKKIPFFVDTECKGTDLVGIHYEQLFDFVLPNDNPEEAFRVISGDFVTTEDGTGIVHTAPTFGADDAMVAKEAGVPAMLVKDENDQLVPLVDLQGKFRPEMGEYAGKYVKNEYYNEGEAPEKSVDVELCIDLKERNRAFKVEKYEHSYPHCWRTDKPILYYPLDSWFIKVTDVKERLTGLNKTINWKPESTGTGRFGNWLENANDWNLSRSRYWGTPIPIWRTEDRSETKCIGSIEELKAECDKAVAAGIMDKNPIGDFTPGDFSKENYKKVDLHKHLVDEITLVSEKGEPMQREADLIDVWFDSGSMPYAQWHYPFENKDLIDDKKSFPADFIAEGVDQTRGWFYTLHTIGTMVFDSVAYKNVISNGLVLDETGQKMSKSKGNTVDPFKTLEKYGPDATRWYMITNAQPWDNLKFSLDGLQEVQRKFFGTLYNTYSFFGLYANIDEFSFSEKAIPVENRPEIDRWVLSRLHSLIKEVDVAYETYEPTKAGRLIQEFVNDHLSNWYVRLCRRRFWKGDYTEDKISAYQTLYECLEVVAQLSAPIAPFFMDQLFQDLNKVSGRHEAISVHLSDFPKADENAIDIELEERMSIAQKVSSLVLSLRKKEQIKVRQPLQKIMVPALSNDFKNRIAKVEDLILSEVNVKTLEVLEDTSGVLVKQIKPNFKTIGPKYGKQMKLIAGMVKEWGQDNIAEVETNNGWKGTIDGTDIELTGEDFEIIAKDIPGWLVATDGPLTVALDITLTDALKEEGIARELVNRIQNMRKDSGLEVTDRIAITYSGDADVIKAIVSNSDYIKAEVLANSINDSSNEGEEIELEEGKLTLSIAKV